MNNKTMFEKPILIYSDYCVYSSNFLKTLMKYPDLYNSFIRMNIDTDPSTKKRPTAFYQIQKVLDIKITKVPTLITPNAQYILSDVEAFKWLEYQIKLLTAVDEELKPFNPNEMMSFSDNYANFGSTDLCDAKEQNFKFYDNGKLTDDNFLKTDKTWDPNNKDKTNGFLNDLESNTPKMDYNTKQNERKYFDKTRNDGQQQQQPANMSQGYISQPSINSNYYSEQRTQSPSPQMNKKSINFTDPNFGLSGNMGGGKNKMSEKSKEIDMKLQQMLQDRESIDMTLNQRARLY